MTFTNDVNAFWAIALVVPAVLFVSALFLRQLPRPGSHPARIADRIVRWYAAHPQFALWVLLLGLPLAAFVLGGSTLLRTWGENPQLRYWAWRVVEEIPEHWPAMTVGGATLVSASLLVTITAHLMAGQSQRPSVR